MDQFFEPFIDPDDPSQLPDPELVAACETQEAFDAYMNRRIQQILAGGAARPPQAEPEPQRLTEADLCERYIETHQPTVFAEGRFWRCPNRRVWEPVPDDLFAREVLDTLTGCQDEGPAPHPRSVAAITALLRLRLAECDPAHWDQPVLGLPFPTQLLELDHGEWHDLAPGRYIATTLPFAYDYAAQAPAWQQFLQSTIPAAAPFLQEFAGYCLLPDNRFELSLWLYGPPQSGKATCLLGLQTLLGPFAAHLPLADLAARRLDPALLARKRLLVCHEPPLQPATARPLDALVSGEPLSLQRLHQASVSVRAQARLALTFHTFPAHDPAFASLYQRAALVIFPGLPPGAADPSLKARIAAEGPGLFNWAFAGLRRLLTRGRFEPTATLLAATELLRLTHRAPEAFVAQCCHRDPNAITQASHLHHAYVNWCQRLGLQPMSAKKLAAEWERLGFIRHRPKSISHWHGVELLPHALPDQPVPPSLPAPSE